LANDLYPYDSLKKEGKITIALYKEHRPQILADIGFASIGLDEPYRVFISEDPILRPIIFLNARSCGGHYRVKTGPPYFIKTKNLNLYVYSWNSPLIFKYPLGLEIVYRDCDEWLCLPATPPLPYPKLCARTCICVEIECGEVKDAYPCVQWGWAPGPYPAPGKPGGEPA
jgi:hypothetical protein